MSLMTIALITLVSVVGATWAPEPLREASWSQEQDSVCADAQRVSRLARIAEADDSASIQAQADLWCAAKEDGRSLNWQTGRTARYSSGAWNYPNRVTARYASGSWNYPNRKTARYSSGVLNYPDGRTARYASGKWQIPRGTTSVTEAELLSGACARLGDGACSRPLKEITALSGFDRELAIIELAWSARRR